MAAPRAMRGRSLRPLLAARAGDGASGGAGTLTPAQRLAFAVPRAQVELYDLARDPWELANVAGDPAPHARRRDAIVDRVTGVRFGDGLPPLLPPLLPPFTDAAPARAARRGSLP